MDIVHEKKKLGKELINVDETVKKLRNTNKLSRERTLELNSIQDKLEIEHIYKCFDSYSKSPFGFNLDVYKGRDGVLSIVCEDKFDNKILEHGSLVKPGSLVKGCERGLTRLVNKSLMSLLEKKIISIYEDFEEERKNGNTDYDYLKDVNVTVEKGYGNALKLPIQRKGSSDIGFLKCNFSGRTCSIEPMAVYTEDMTPIEDWSHVLSNRFLFSSVGIKLGTTWSESKELKNNIINKNTPYHGCFSPQYLSVITNILVLNKVSKVDAKKYTKNFIQQLVDGTAPELIKEGVSQENLARKDIFEEIERVDGWKLKLDNKTDKKEVYTMKRGNNNLLLTIGNIDENYSAEKLKIAVNFNGTREELRELHDVVNHLIENNIKYNKRRNNQIKRGQEGKGFDL